MMPPARRRLQRGGNPGGQAIAKAKSASAAEAKSATSTGRRKRACHSSPLPNPPLNSPPGKRKKKVLTPSPKACTPIAKKHSKMADVVTPNTEGKGRWCTPYVPFERNTVFCMTKAHEVYDLPNSGVDAWLLTEADFTNKDWLKCFKEVPKRGSKVKCRDMKPEPWNKFYVLFTSMYQEPSRNRYGGANLLVEKLRGQLKDAEDALLKAEDSGDAVDAMKVEQLKNTVSRLSLTLQTLQVVVEEKAPLDAMDSALKERDFTQELEECAQARMDFVKTMQAEHFIEVEFAGGNKCEEQNSKVLVHDEKKDVLDKGRQIHNRNQTLADQVSSIFTEASVNQRLKTPLETIVEDSYSNSSSKFSYFDMAGSSSKVDFDLEAGIGGETSDKALEHQLLFLKFQFENELGAKIYKDDMERYCVKVEDRPSDVRDTVPVIYIGDHYFDDQGFMYLVVLNPSIVDKWGMTDTKRKVDVEPEEVPPALNKPNLNKLQRINDMTRVNTDNTFLGLYKFDNGEHTIYYRCEEPLVAELSDQKRLYVFSYAKNRKLKLIMADKYDHSYANVDQKEQETHIMGEHSLTITLLLQNQSQLLNQPSQWDTL
ncbi:hypothetical protein L7F22_026722 [Adiantum nelumboides]|nr:hypothetical protein [Adiantum nelumboides]